MDRTDDILAVGERVALRRVQPGDRAAFCALVTASSDHLLRWIHGGVPPDDADGSAWFKRTLKQAAEGRSEKLLVVRADAPDVLLGALNINEIVRGGFQSAYLGYWLGAGHTGQGLMGEALRIGLAYAFGPLGLHRVEANIQPGNEPSIRLVERAGFVREGYSERYLRIGPAWRDHERWALTLERWEAKNETGGPEGPPAS